MGPTIEEILIKARQRIVSITDLSGCDALEIELLGRRQGALTALLRRVGELPPEERRAFGKRVNAAKIEVEQLFRKRREEITRSESANLSESEWLDVTAPGARMPHGFLNPIMETIRDVATIFERIGFIRVRHPEVDSEYYAFESLNMPEDHPARDEWETFFVAGTTKNVSDEELGISDQGRIVLTPHTSNGQVREMEKGILPIRMVNIGKCYRRQIDATHTPMFHQFEGLLIDRDVSVTHLKGTLDYFVQSYFGPDRRTRLRPFHFRFTEPSFEVDISCAVCGGTGVRPHFAEASGGNREASGVSTERCRTCKSGWLELGGAGTVHPNVLRAGGVDPNKWNGFAFGWGIERVLMMKTGISDIRLLYSNDLRWLRAW
ncbi:MAG: phenylalanine--tRNA ligase subunit alpha [Candidatus Uhrbacteria bacterium]